MSRWTLLFALSACAGHRPDPGTPAELLAGVADRAGRLLPEDAYGEKAERLVYLDQGWGPAETMWFYYADQGSMLLPYTMFVHLEQATNERRLLSDDNLSRLRLLAQHPTPNNPDGLPVGFTRHEDSVGLTCAACHTAQVSYRGTAMRIDGGPARADVIGLLHDIEASIQATLADEAKLRRYVAAVGGGPDTRKSLEETYAWFHSYNTVNTSTTPEGYARIDAVDRIVNQAIRFTSGPEHSISPNAPASLPVLWDAPRHDFVQWTGFAPNEGAGALGRNVGEVVGVYGHVEVQRYQTEEAARRGYQSSIQANNLVSIEESLRGLRSPAWPTDILGALDAPLAERGAAIYAQECASCHAVIDRDDPKRSVTAYVVALDKVGTDPTAAMNLVSARVPSGVLEGALSPDGEVYGAEIPALVLLKDLDVRILSAHPDAVVRAIANAKLAGLGAATKQGDYTRSSDADPFSELKVYKARPLNGIWASSPYLHNGSVPDLYSLLLPPAERPRSFSVGKWEFDPRLVGYVSTGTEPFDLDTTLTGNSNAGHLYGTTLPDADRWALVEYLKSL